MDGISIFLIAIGLAMDAFAVSVASGAVAAEERLKAATAAAIFFGGFQALMPLVGWLAGSEFSDAVIGYGHWVAFCLLAMIGGKMIRDSSSPVPEKRAANLLNYRVLTFLAVATSIDALAVGVSFAFLEVYLLFSVAVIGIVTFLLSFIGVYIGGGFAGLFERRIEIFGGLILIGISLKILLEGLFF
ncbi:manganese efflux pump MntP family protein [Methanotrichaceae archaeon M04Ac]|uniref:Putative manganese efflux pump MntP n=1 Tax=Candidatus Methanocrinis alkalitolerans TaxID=3033395 RepID=A0ABT5XDH7_9EURY|nr:manganese efflux pump MntP family protein [Candidatus Methanocrinis alkalitolerans]MDF0592775.1 manganese efflux pump MntP family protein [Candidatus Methanocrinis alkalitolerans]